MCKTYDIVASANENIRVYINGEQVESIDAWNDPEFLKEFESNKTGSDYYKKAIIHPSTYSQLNKLTWYEACVTKRMFRHDKVPQEKGKQDCYKSIDEIIKILEIRYKHKFKLEDMDKYINGG